MSSIDSNDDDNIEALMLKCAIERYEQSPKKYHIQHLYSGWTTEVQSIAGLYTDKLQSVSEDMDSIKKTIKTHYIHSPIIKILPYVNRTFVNKNPKEIYLLENAGYQFVINTTNYDYRILNNPAFDVFGPFELDEYYEDGVENCL
jgi:carbohydrate-binding DOMON domain-containing protein